MIKKWRPKGWKNKYEEKASDINHNLRESQIGLFKYLVTMSKGYEAGADAMLEALRREEIPSYLIEDMFLNGAHILKKMDRTYYKGIKVKIVFIPADEEVNDV